MFKAADALEEFGPVLRIGCVHFPEFDIVLSVGGQVPKQEHGRDVFFEEMLKYKNPKC